MHVQQPLSFLSCVHVPVLADNVIKTMLMTVLQSTVQYCTVTDDDDDNYDDDDVVMVIILHLVRPALYFSLVVFALCGL